MKKGLVLILAFLYITLTSGVVVNIHYCMGRLSEVTYGHDTNEKCDKCGMKQKNGCCETEHKFIKTQDSHFASKSVNAPGSVYAIVPNVFSTEVIAVSLSKRHDNPRYHSPPDNRSNQLGLYNSVFRI